MIRSKSFSTSALKRGVACCSLASAFVATSVHAQEQTYASEYQNRIKAAGAIQPLSGSPFGESVDLYTGATSFEQVDLVLEGQGPAIRIARRSLRGDRSAAWPMKYSGFGDWELEIPQITALVAGSAKTNSTVGIWRVFDSSFQPSDLRCSYLGHELWYPEDGAYGQHTGATDSTFWGQPFELDIPGVGSQTILLRSGTAPAPPGTYPGVTNQHWQIGCLPATTSGQAGEAFLALAPDGTKYFLTQMMFDAYKPYREADSITGMWWITPRNMARMKATRVEDRFGNYISYGYSGDKLTSITGSDGRSVSIEWWSDAPLIKSITANGRIWNYAYASRSETGGTLSQITLPDNTAWAFTGTAKGPAFGPVAISPLCMDPYQDLSPLPESDSGVTATYTIKSPTGVQGVFRYSTRLRAQSNVPSFCDPNFGQIGESQNPYFFVSSLVQRELSGPGLAMATWNYTYEDPHPSMDRYCGTTGCQGTTYTDVIEPDGSRTRYIHSTRYDVLQGKLLRSEVYGSNGLLIRSDDNLYNYASGDRPYPGTMGYSLFPTSPVYAGENIVIARKNITSQQERTFTWEVPTCSGGLNGYCFDAYGRPTKVVKSSAPSP